MTELRFRVADNLGRFGSSWTVRANPANGDIVVSHREAGRWVHATFHKATGEWHFAVTGGGQRNYLGSLREHVEVAPGWNHAMRISVAVDELRSGWSEEVRERPLITIPTFESFDEVVIDLFLGRAERAELDPLQAKLVGEFDLGTARLPQLWPVPHESMSPYDPLLLASSRKPSPESGHLAGMDVQQHGLSSSGCMTTAT